jgi:predicted nucleic acid-binding protein
VRVFFDATVWCGAILNPAGINARLLDLAATGGPLRGFTSDVVLLEFFRNATGGTLPQTFEREDVWAYVEAHEPLLEVEQAPIGRSLPRRTDLHNLPLNEIVYHLTGKQRDDLLAELEEPSTLKDFDSNDLHVLAAAVSGGAEAICSSDGTFEPITWIDTYKPGRLAAEFGQL